MQDREKEHSLSSPLHSSNISDLYANFTSFALFLLTLNAIIIVESLRCSNFTTLKSVPIEKKVDGNKEIF